jgi:tetratricopeptide (TPR) repeat protein
MRATAAALIPLASLLVLADPSHAQQRPRPAQGGAQSGPEAKKAELDQLFEALRTAPDEQGAAMVEARIRMAWSQQVSPATGLLLRRGIRNMEAQVPEEAVEDFDAALTLQPEAAEAWVLRARALAVLGDRAAAARDLQQALTLEPRHFGALLALSELQDEAGDAAGALRSLQAALAIHPKMPTGEARLRDLRRKAFGEEL